MDLARLEIQRLVGKRLIRLGWAPVGITKLLQSVGGAWGQRARRQRLSCRGQFSKVHKTACALGGTGREGRGHYLGSGHRWLKWLGCFQELGPPPLIKRREACSPLMLGQLPNRGWLTKQRPGRDARDRGQKGERTGKCKHGAGVSGAAAGGGMGSGGCGSLSEWLAAWPKGRGRLLCWELSGRGL